MFGSNYPKVSLMDLTLQENKALMKLRKIGSTDLKTMQ
jgi:hypothetical protein